MDHFATWNINFSENKTKTINMQQLQVSMETRAAGATSEPLMDEFTVWMKINKF